MPAGVSAWVPLANITLGGAAGTVTFSSINQSYRDLVVVANTTTSSATQILFKFNNDSTQAYSYGYMSGDGGARYTSTWVNQNWIYTQTNFSEQSTSMPTVSIANIFDYSSTDRNKTVVIRTSSDIAVIATSGRYITNTAINSITLGTGTSSFAAGSTFALYGVSA